MYRALIAATGMILLTACSGGGGSGPAMRAEPSNLGNNTSGVFQPNNPSTIGTPNSGSEGVTTNGQMQNPANPTQ